MICRQKTNARPLRLQPVKNFTASVFCGWNSCRTCASRPMKWNMKRRVRKSHLHCDDRENLYAIGFRTPPSDSTGVPHILEHSVLAGSERYPLKDAFNELIKGPSRPLSMPLPIPIRPSILWPVRSATDFFNLARVYTDLVLRPRLLKETFYQEGHHLEFTDPEDEESNLTVSGIVYNEMKGAYSSPDSTDVQGHPGKHLSRYRLCS